MAGIALRANVEVSAEEAAEFASSASELVTYLSQNMHSANALCAQGAALSASRLAFHAKDVVKSKNGSYVIPWEAIEALHKLAGCASEVARHADLVRVLASAAAAVGTIGLVWLDSPIVAFAGYGTSIAAGIIGPVVKIPLLED